MAEASTPSEGDMMRNYALLFVLVTLGWCVIAVPVIVLLDIPILLGVALFFASTFAVVGVADYVKGRQS
ncbi:hypothetical protein ABT282_08035 [Streptomyces sp. NPDC000927]|uniref:hypothetical protein n=1 Tax=Streptomyces sp. NPDC000927 TaxID=3154371 RepID=UPI00332FEF04